MDAQSNIQSLFLEQLHEGCPALTPAVGQAMAEAAAVCLEAVGYLSEVDLFATGDYTAQYNLTWNMVTEQMRRSHNDLEEATEHGACGIAILLIRDLIGYTVIERARKGSGIDYWLGIEEEFPFQRRGLLEVSGILRGDESIINARVRQKMDQSARSEGQYTAYIVVVEFSRAVVRVVKK